MHTSFVVTACRALDSEEVGINARMPKVTASIDVTQTTAIAMTQQTLICTSSGYCSTSQIKTYSYGTSAHRFLRICGANHCGGGACIYTDIAKGPAACTVQTDHLRVVMEPIRWPISSPIKPNCRLRSSDKTREPSLAPAAMGKSKKNTMQTHSLPRKVETTHSATTTAAALIPIPPVTTGSTTTTTTTTTTSSAAAPPPTQASSPQHKNARRGGRNLPNTAATKGASLRAKSPKKPINRTISHMFKTLTVSQPPTLQTASSIDSDVSATNCEGESATIAAPLPTNLKCADSTSVKPVDTTCAAQLNSHFSPHTTERKLQLVEFIQSHPSLFEIAELKKLQTAESILSYTTSILKQAYNKKKALHTALETLTSMSDCPEAAIQFITQHQDEFTVESLEVPPRALLMHVTSLEKQYLDVNSAIDSAIESILHDDTIQKEDKISVVQLMKDRRSVAVKYAKQLLGHPNASIIQDMKTVADLAMEQLHLVHEKVQVILASIMPIPSSIPPVYSSTGDSKFYLDVSSAQSICEGMEILAPHFLQLGLRLKTRFSANKLVEHVVFPDFVGRDTSLKIIRGNLEKRCNPQQAVPEDKRTMNPLIAIVGAPGSGKQEGVSDISCTTISWSGDAPYWPYCDDHATGLLGLFLRMLYSHWFVNGGFQTFVSHIQNWESLVELSSSKPHLFDILFDAIVRHSKKRHFLLCVDEILLSDGGSNTEVKSQFICSQLGKMMDDNMITVNIPDASAFIVVLSCLDRGWVQSVETGSSRRIIAPPLDPIPFRLCVKLFKEHLNHLEPEAKVGLKLLLLDTGGVPCLLTSINNWLKKDTSASMLLQNHTYCLATIMAGTRTGFSGASSLDVIRAVIIAKRLESDSLIGGKKFAQLVACGYLFCVDNKPYTSVLTLLAFADEFTSHHLPASTFEAIARLLELNAENIPFQVANLLKFLLNPAVSWLDGQALEDFATLHPFLLTLCHDTNDRGRPFCVNSMFGNPIFSRGACTNTLTAIFPRLPRFHCWNASHEGKTHRFSSWFQSNGSSLKVGSVVRCCANNPGFETVFLLPYSDGEGKFIICLEAKYSEASSKTVLTVTEILDKWRNAQLQMRGLMQTVGWRGATLILMIVSLRKLPANRNFPEIPTDANILIVDRANFVEYLGPTLGRRFDSLDEVCAYIILCG
ncbi:hypothetical protein Pelo_3953 [Pelomyxa schiedti]|nr:hypothetical protein Pelo_3953 [Pelomyxa schiedti]